ncbi:MAG TPA: NAD(P)-binding domain-containing protein [Dehalococcoidia bacterium]|nr:NAD(P)-binding domain-containing protein [Dehalococcoidia bacterium]
MAERVGLIGLGIMGKPMARNLLRAGFSLTVFNRTRGKSDELAGEGASVGASPAEVARMSDVIITIVTNSPDVEQVALGEKGVIEGVQKGAVLVDMSTISPDVTRTIGGRMAERGVAMLDAPVSGGERGAIDGTLSIMVGGEAQDFERCRPVFEAMGKKLVHCGPLGAGQTVKLCNQIVVGLNNLAMSECLVFAAASGISVDRMLEAVSAGAAGSWALSNLAPKLLKRDFSPGFKVGLQQKDLRLALEAADHMHLSLPGLALTHQLYSSLERRGLADEGNQALVRALEYLSDVTIRGDGLGA